MAKGTKPKTLFGLELEKLWIAAGFRNRAAFLKAADLQNPTVYRWETTWGRPEENLLARAATALRKDVGDLQALWRRCQSQAEAYSAEAAEPALAARGSVAPGLPVADPVLRVVGAGREWLGMYLDAKGFESGSDRRGALEKRLAEAAGLDGITPGVVKTIAELFLSNERNEARAAEAEAAGAQETAEARRRGDDKGHKPLPPKPRRNR